MAGVMNKIIGLLLVVGLVAAAYTYRDKIAALRGGATEEETVSGESPMEVAPRKPDLTPNPARESQAQAAKLYPGLAISGSPMNKKFLALHAEAKATDPELL